MTERPDDVALALALADHSDALTMPRFGAVDLHVDTKPDLTPVTDADRSVEAELRRILSSARPGDAVVGEEYGGTTEFVGRQWVIDPIDGTKNFVRGVPVWATLIALLEDGVPVAGVVSAPALHRRWWAAAGSGGVRGGSTVRRRGSFGCRRLPTWRRQACRSPAFPAGARGSRPASSNSPTRCGGSAAYGDFLSYCLVAEGAVTSRPNLVSVWDLAPLDILVREAGGTFTP